MADVVSILTADPDLLAAKVAEAKAELDARPKFGDHLLAGRDLITIEGGQQGPDVPEGFDPNSLKPIGFLRDRETYIVGTEMQRRAVEELNASYGRKMLWWLLNHQELIPEKWKQAPYIVFAGDYDLRDSGGSRWGAGDRVLTPCNS